MRINQRLLLSAGLLSSTCLGIGCNTSAPPPAGPAAQTSEAHPVPDGETARQDTDAEWQADFFAFNEFLAEIVSTARTPTVADFEDRPDEEFDVITDGGGGVVDFHPAEGTVQFEANEACRGRRVMWDLTLLQDAGDYAQFGLLPQWAEGVDLEEMETNPPTVLGPLIEWHRADLPATPLMAGQRIRLSGTIGDAADNSNQRDSFHGVTTIYYLEDLAHPVFQVALKDVTVTRIDPTEEELAVTLLSDRANIDQRAWEVLQASSESEANQAPHAIDGDPASIWRTTREDDQQHLLVDMGRTQTVTGIRYLPPQDPPTEGSVGAFSLFVSDSIDDPGPPVVTGRFALSRAEQELQFEPVAGRYFRFVMHSQGAGPPSTAVAELHLLDEPVDTTALLTAGDLPPLADAIEEFELLRAQLPTVLQELDLSADQHDALIQIHTAARSRWYFKYLSATHDLLSDETWHLVNNASEEQPVSGNSNASFWAAAASPEFTSDAQRNEMDGIARGMRSARAEYLADVMRVLSRSQQEQLRDALLMIQQ